MYKKHPQGWVKHIDLLLLDLITVLVSFWLVCALRQGEWFPFHSILHRNVMFLIAPVHFVGTLCLDNHKNVLKRGYLKELLSVVQISLFDAFSLAFYLFITQTGEEFSRMVILGFLFATLAALYMERVAWKKYLLHRKSRKPYFANHLLVVTHSLIAESVVKRTIENSFGEYEVVGVILKVMEKSTKELVVSSLADDGETTVTTSTYIGKEILSIPQVGGWMREILNYKWVVIVVAVGLVVAGCIPRMKKDTATHQTVQQE